MVSDTPRIIELQITDDSIVAHLADGRVISVPLAWSWRLSEATPAQRSNFEFVGSGLGVHWPDMMKTSAQHSPLGQSAAPRPRVSPSRTPHVVSGACLRFSVLPELNGCAVGRLHRRANWQFAPHLSPELNGCAVAPLIVRYT